MLALRNRATGLVLRVSEVCGSDRIGITFIHRNALYNSPSSFQVLFKRCMMGGMVVIVL